MNKELFNEAPFSTESHLGDILRNPKSDSTMQFLGIYKEWNNIFSDNNATESDRKEAQQKLRIYKGQYLAVCLKPIGEYLSALVVKYAPSYLITDFLEKAKELGYVCPINEVYDVLRSMPCNISRLMLSEIDNVNVIIAFDDCNRDSFMAALRDSKGNIKDLLLICGFVLQVKPFDKPKDLDIPLIKPKLAFYGLENPYSDEALCKDTESEVDSEPFSLSYANEMAQHMLRQIVQLRELIPNEDILEIDRILESNIYRDELETYLLALGEPELDEGNSQTDRISESTSGDLQINVEDKRPLPPADLLNRKRLQNDSLINATCQYLQSWFEGSNVQDLKYVFFGIGDMPPARSLILSTDKKFLTMFITYLFGSKNIKRENWVYFANYINNNNEPVYPLGLDDSSWKSNPPSGFASANEKADFAKNVLPKAIRAKLNRDLTKEEEEDLK